MWGLGFRVYGFLRLKAVQFRMLFEFPADTVAL